MKSSADVIGCDLGDKKTAVVVLSGERKTRVSVPTTPAALEEFFAKRPPATVVLEVGTHSRWVSEVIARAGHDVVVANPRRLEVISKNQTKTDWRDAELLARLGRADRSLLSPVKHRSMGTHADLCLARSRDLLVRTRTRLVNFVRSTMKSFGERLPKCDAAGFHRRTAALIPEVLQAVTAPVYELLANLEEQIKTLDKKISEAAKKYPEVDVVSQPSGVGQLTAFVFVLTLEDKTRFSKSRTAGAFFGLRPAKRQSGNGDPELRITKAGDGFVRRLLVNAANYVLGPLGPECDLRTWGLRLVERGGRNARKRAKVAVARKLAVLMHRLWVTGEVYQAVGYGRTPLAAA